LLDYICLIDGSLVVKSKKKESFLFFVCVCVFSELRSEVIVCFVDIGRIIDHHCLNFKIRGDSLFCWYLWNCWPHHCL